MGLNGNAMATVPTSAVDPQIAAAMELQGRLDPLRDALGLADLTDSEMSLFAMVSLHLELDPFARQIYAIRRKGKITHQVAIDGARASAERTGEYRGSDEPTFGPIIDMPFPHPEWARTTVHRQLANGEWIHQSATVWWDEYFPGSGPDGFMWVKMARNQLAKCSEMAAFRKAFPKRFGQVYVTEEMQQADAVAQARPVGETAREHAAAERARIEATTSGSGSPAGESAPPVPSPDTAAAPAVDVPPPVEEAEAAADPVTGEVIEVIEGTAVDVTEGLSAGELREALGKALIGVSEGVKHIRATYGDKVTIDNISPAQRAEVLAAMKAMPR